MLPYGDVSSIHFYVAGDDENKTDSYVPVKRSDTFVIDGTPYVNGIYDSRMGTTSNNWSCATCRQRKDDCLGHGGILHLRYPVQSPLFKEELLKWLKIICSQCGNLVCINTNIQTTKAARMGEYIKLSQTAKGAKPVICQSCGAPHYNVTRDKANPLVIYKEFKRDDNSTTKVQIFNHEIAQIFDRITKETLALVGRDMDSHPRKFILHTLHIPPNTIRPDMKRVSGSKGSTNDINTILKAIVTINDDIPADMTPNMVHESDISKSIKLLEIGIYDLIKGSSNANKLRVAQGNSAALKSIASDLPGKKNNIRGALMGKRTHYVCRSVISGDPTLKLNEVGVSLYIAKKIQLPETVHTWNMDKVNIYFNNGINNYPGCTKVVKYNNKKAYYIDNVKSTFRLEEGDVIYRDLIDGDVMAFNRAPSLSVSSISCHNIRIMNIPTLAFNVSDCNLYNADFDGDEMNGHFALTQISINEIKYLMNIGERLISYQYGKPVIGSFQDALIGGAMFTMHGQRFSKLEVMDMFQNVPDKYLKRISFDKFEYTNYEILTMILPNINFVGTPKFFNKNMAHKIKYNPNDIKVLIDNGKYISGILDKSSIGQDQINSITHIIKNVKGSEAALDFIFTLQQIIMTYLQHYGFSLGIKDMLISDKAMKEIHEKTSAIIADSQRITDRLNNGQLIPPIGMSTEEYYELQQIESLNSGDDFTNTIIEDIDCYKNRLYLLMQVGSKGNMTNLQAISSAVGQQTINGARIKPLFGYKRTLPYYTSFDTNPMSKGYIPDSYTTGLRLPGMLLASMDARFALIKKALSTSITGDQNRTAVKNLESAVVNNNRSTVKSNRIVQCIYGDSGLDPRSLEIVKIPTVMISDAEFATYKTDPKTIDSKYQGAAVTELLDAEFKQLQEDRQIYRDICLSIEYNSGVSNRLFTNKIKNPLHMERIINDTIFKYKSANSGARTLNIAETILKIGKLCYELPYLSFNDRYRELKKHIPSYWENSFLFTRILIRSYLNIKTLKQHNINDDMIDVIIDQINITYKSAFIEYGTSVGIIAAQSLSEPLTQFVIDAHHRSGGAGTTTNKLVRMAEVLGAKSTDKMKNPSMIIHVNEDIEGDESKVQEIANHIEMMNVKRFTNEFQLFYEQYGNPVHSKYKHEKKLIEDFERNNPVKPPGDLLNYCIRFELIRDEMILKNMPIESIIEMIQDKYPKLYIVYTPENVPTLVVRCYMRAEVTANKRDDRNAMIDLVDKIANIVIRGVDGIIFTEVIKEKLPRHYVDETGAIRDKKIYVIQTIGTNLIGVMNHPMIDPYRVNTNSLREIEEVFGIEYARDQIIAELKMIDDSTSISGPSYQHYTIYADEMTCTGKITQIERTGVSKREASNVLLRMSTSSPIQHLENSAVMSITDNLEGGISARLMLGSTVQMGSLYNDVVIDEAFIKAHTTNIQSVIDDL